MAGHDRAIHVFNLRKREKKTWITGTTPVMTAATELPPPQTKARPANSRTRLLLGHSTRALTHFYLREFISTRRQVEYLNSGIAFSSSLVALNSA
jgi:hypothetical protein